MIKFAAASDLPVVEDIMRRIHAEDPSYWPHGLSKEHFSATGGELYLVQKSASADPVGFVGWQKIPEGGKNVGYYAIGILPEHREAGFAKQAVTQVMQKMARECDEIKAMIMEHNEPSKALAASLRIPTVIEKAANARTIGSIAGGLGSTLLFDQAADPERSVASTFQPWTWDKQRLLMGGLNAILGGVGGSQLADGNTAKGLTAIAMAPAKDLAMKGVGTLHNVDEAAKAFADKSNSKLSKGLALGGGALGLGALGLLAYSAKKKNDLQRTIAEEQNKGRIKITLPTKDPDDSETEIELPLGELNLTNALQGRLHRDTKRRLYAETRQRTRRRKPKDPKNPTEKEKEDADLDKEEKELDKTASLLAELEFYKRGAAGGPAPGPPGNVPSPPIPGQNPAMRMNQQAQATANAITPAPEANPQVMEAQQAAMQAEQAGAQQAAEMEQQFQASQMEQQAQFQQELMKAEEEKEVLRLQLEKEKALRELDGAVSKSQADSATGEGTETQKLISSRLDRLQQRVGNLSKVASLENFKHVKPHALQEVNTAPAGEMLAQPVIGRNSYGPLGDQLFDWFGRSRLYTPTPPRVTRINRTSILNSPDKFGMLSQLYNTGQSMRDIA